MNFKALILPIITGMTLSGIYLMPEAGEMIPSAVDMNLPKQINAWQFQYRPPSAEEIRILANDTEFSKAICLRPRPGEYTAITGSVIPDRIDLSVVLSGHDLNDSLHRPERCMRSQGHVISRSDRVIIELPNGRKIPTRRLISTQSVPTDESHTNYVSFQSITYYYFVGNKTITEDHLERTIVDIKDRLVHGVDQRWAYISVTMWYGEVPWIRKIVTEKEADQKLKEFLSDFSVKQIDWSELDIDD